MNLKQYLLPLSLALLTTWAVQFFIVNRYYNTTGDASGVVKSGQTFLAPQSYVESQPLNRELDFVQEKTQTPAQQTRVDTATASYIFSNQGACLEQLIFKRLMNGQMVALKTIEVPQTRESHCFLVALNEKTPYAYALTSQKQLEGGVTQLTYQAETDQARIEKTFTIYESKFQIDLGLKITPKKSDVLARIFFSSPAIPEVKEDVISALYNSQKGAVKKELRNKLDLNQGWFAPTFFGSENRYFVHAMVADPQSFAQRAYYALSGQNDLISILESAPITKPTDWSLSFYFGPKEDEVMNLVDPRLEQTLDYSGWLAPLSRLLLMVLKYLYSFLHNYGWAIIVMTILINLLLLPLNIKSAQSLKKYGEFQKKLSYIQQRYKDDADTLNREKAELIAKHGMPGLGGCLPKLLQLPIFFALSRVLSSSIELYKAPFALWIHDLSARDPYYVLPILIGISMIFASSSADPKQRFTMIAVALVFGAVSINFSAGLCLYILVGILLTGLQTVIQKKMNWA